MRRVVPGPCPVCNSEIEYLYQTENIPFFSDILLMTASCECGYRLVDTIILGAGDPVRYTLAVESPEDLEVKVVRSTTGTIEIPELGIKVEPGPICEAFISNVEGVLYRFESVVDRVLSWAEDEQRDRAIALKAKIDDARDLAFPFTLILEDPDGNSAIISPKAAQEPLVAEATGE